MSTRLTLLCHAATRATRAAAFPLDEPLEAASAAKATAMSGSLGRVDAAWTSPALRARQTAAAIGLAAAIEPALADLDIGAWAGRSLADIEAADPTGLARWAEDTDAAPHGGEPVARVLQRVAAWLDTKVGQEGRFVAVTHAAILRAAILVALDADHHAFWRIDVAPLRTAVLQGRAGRWTLRV